MAPPGRVGRGVAAVILASVALILSGCASAAGRTSMTWPPGMTNVLIAHCLEEQPLGTDTSLRVDQDGWLASSQGTTYTDKPPSDVEHERTRSTLPPAQSATTPNEATNISALDSFGVCMSVFRIDYSLVYTDDLSQRARLYDYYTARLVPCLARFGWHTVVPDRLTFEQTPYGGWDPYLIVATSKIDLARRVVTVCPPAPAGMLGASRVIATARGATPIR